MADLADREAAAQGRLPAGQRSRLEAAEALTSSSQTSAAVAGSSKASAVTLTWYRPPPAAQSTSARSRSPSGVVGVAKVSS